MVASLVEGVGINATSRLTGVHKETVLKLLADMGCACAAFHDEKVRALKPDRVECDELWAFVHCKQKRVKNAVAAPVGAGDCWTFTAIDADSKLVISYLIGPRSPQNAMELMLDVAGRVTNWTQLTTDGFAAYPAAVREAFGDEVSYAQLIKVYREDRSTEARYSPATCVGCKKEHISGAPDPEKISTSIIERHNLTMRMHQRRYTRLTNGHSKKLSNHGHATALFMAYYNWCRPHQALDRKTTPAMASGLTDRVWTIDELIGLLN